MMVVVTVKSYGPFHQSSINYLPLSAPKLQQSAARGRQKYDVGVLPAVDCVLNDRCRRRWRGHHVVNGTLMRQAGGEGDRFYLGRVWPSVAFCRHSRTLEG